ncbi:hypothetical protein Patl1_00383 [Pistacia atlantica]|uniref:Uncharacterized protein n=1 Tax=Pistacia atlantica TaxID=434234 RepID=A0ACC1C472_9ROSI|nr:hypothetical protein Patl1_00383 [Pistacia atlantica]
MSSSLAVRDIDPLLKDLKEKKQSFGRNVVSLAAELKEVRSRLASQEQSFVKENLTRTQKIWDEVGEPDVERDQTIIGD